MNRTNLLIAAAALLAGCAPDVVSRGPASGWEAVPSQDTKSEGDDPEGSEPCISPYDTECGGVPPVDPKEEPPTDPCVSPSDAPCEGTPPKEDTTEPPLPGPFPVCDSLLGC